MQLFQLQQEMISRQSMALTINALCGTEQALLEQSPPFSIPRGLAQAQTYCTEAPRPIAIIPPTSQVADLSFHTRIFAAESSRQFSYDLPSFVKFGYRLPPFSRQPSQLATPIAPLSWLRNDSYDQANYRFRNVKARNTFELPDPCKEKQHPLFPLVSESCYVTPVRTANLIQRPPFGPHPFRSFKHVMRSPNSKRQPTNGCFTACRKRPRLSNPSCKWPQPPLSAKKMRQTHAALNSYHQFWQGIRIHATRRLAFASKLHSGSICSFESFQKRPGTVCR